MKNYEKYINELEKMQNCVDYIKAYSSLLEDKLLEISSSSNNEEQNLALYENTRNIEEYIILNYTLGDKADELRGNIEKLIKDLNKEKLA